MSKCDEKICCKEVDRAPIIRFVFLLALIVFSANLSFAKAAGAQNGLSIDQALELVIASHPLISSKKKALQAAKDDLSVAKWQVFPNAAFSFRGFEQDGDEANRDQEVLTVSQPIWTGGRITGAVDLAKAKLEVARLEVIEAQQTLLIDTVRAFIELDQAEASLVISKSNVEEHERLFDIIDRRVKASTSPEVDARLAKARLAFSRSQLLKNKNAVEVSRANLEQLIGQSAAAIITAKNLKKETASLAEAEKAALLFSPAIRKVRQEIIALTASGKVENSAFFPQLSLGYEKKYGELSTGQDDEKVFLGLDFRPGAGLSSRFSLTANKQRAQSLQDTLLALEREIRREVQITWRQYAAAQMQLSPSKLLVSSTSDVMASYLRQYTVGRKSWLDVLNAQRELVQAKKALVDYQANLDGAAYRLHILKGDFYKREMAN